MSKWKITILRISREHMRWLLGTIETTVVCQTIIASGNMVKTESSNLQI